MHILLKQNAWVFRLLNSADPGRTVRRQAALNLYWSKDITWFSCAAIRKIFSYLERTRIALHLAVNYVWYLRPQISNATGTFSDWSNPLSFSWRGTEFAEETGNFLTESSS